MNGTLNNKLGKVSISSDVVAQYAGSTAVECFGIVGEIIKKFEEDKLLAVLKDELDNWKD